MGGCKGIVMETESPYIAGNATIDYALVKLLTPDATNTYGYVQVRASGPVVNETISIAQHTYRKAKRIAATVDDGNCKTKMPAAGIVIYGAATEGRSSGSPVIATHDTAVVVIHNCGCNDYKIRENGGVDIREVVRDLQAKGVAIQDRFANGATTPRPKTLAPPPPPTGQ